MSMTMEHSRRIEAERAGQEIVRYIEDDLQRRGSFLTAANKVAFVPPSATFGHIPTEADVRELLRLRRNRDRFFPMEIFADPAWDILLELYAAELGQHRITVSCACAGAAVPATTALRWINTLEENQLVQRTNDRFDGRRIFLSLTDDGLAAMNDYFDTVPAGSVPI
jgi:DNA-binding MarR family transcriptional regulator